MMKRSAVFGLACALSALLVVATHAQGTAFTYQGFLKQSGNPVNGTFDFRFRLYDSDDPQNSNQVGSTVFVNDLNIQNGLFTVVLDFGAVWNGTPRYLEIGVRSGSSTGSYQVLTPRVKINPTPYAVRAGTANPIGSAGGDLSGTYPNPTVAKIQGRSVSSTAPSTGQVLKWNGSAWAPASDNAGTSFWQQSGSNIYYNSGKVGIGTTSPAYRLHVETSSGPRAIYGYHTATSGINYGVYGQSASTSGMGVYGLASATSGTNYGVYGLSNSPSGYGGYFIGRGYFSGKVGIGTAAPATRLDILGGNWNTATTEGDLRIGNATNRLKIGVAIDGAGAGHVTIAAQGGTDGSSGQLSLGAGNTLATQRTLNITAAGKVGIGTTSPDYRLHVETSVGGGFRAIYGNHTYGGSVPTYGVYGQSASASGTGVYGLATATSGTTYGVQGESASTSGRGVYGRATATSGFAVGVYGQSASAVGSGVYGLATATSGTTSGGRFISDSTSGTGVYGWARATSGTTYGVYGESRSTSGRGVFGWATATSGTNYGVYGRSDSTSGYGGYFVGRGYFSGNVGIGTTSPAYRLHVETSSGSGTAIYGHNTATSGINYGVYGQSASTSGKGVFGWASATSGTTYGVWGESVSTSGRGVYGWATANSGTNYGVYGKSSSTSGTGVFGWATATSGDTFGVYGRSDSPSGVGVYGWATNTTGGGVNYGVYGRTDRLAGGYGVYSYGNLFVLGVKAFQIDHPLSPETHYLNHFCTEGPEPYNVYRGNVVTDAKGYATITLPDYFESINRDPTYHLTVVDDGDDFVLAKVVREIRNNQFTIRTSKPFVKVSWEVKAIRNDLWVQRYGYQTEQEKPEEHRGKYLSPELYGQPKEKGIHYTPEPERLEPNEAPVKP